MATLVIPACRMSSPHPYHLPQPGSSLRIHVQGNKTVIEQVFSDSTKLPSESQPLLSDRTSFDETGLSFAKMVFPLLYGRDVDPGIPDDFVPRFQLVTYSGKAGECLPREHCIDGYGITFDHLVGPNNTNPEVLMINVFNPSDPDSVQFQQLDLTQYNTTSETSRPHRPALARLKSQRPAYTTSTAMAANIQAEMSEIPEAKTPDGNNRTGAGLDVMAQAPVTLKPDTYVEVLPAQTCKSGLNSNIEILPNEILSSIFRCLDTPKPSDSALHDEPTFDLTHTRSATLKAISCVSKRWRLETFPILFKYARCILPKLATSTSLSTPTEPFLDFVRRYSLRKVISSFTLVIHGESITCDSKATYRLDGVEAFWYSLFKIIDPVEVLLAAPVPVLGALTACSVSMEDAYRLDCPCHYLRLKRSSTLVSNSPVLEGISAHEYPTNNQTREIVEPVTANFSIDNIPDLAKRQGETRSNSGDSTPAETISEPKVDVLTEAIPSSSEHRVASAELQESSPNGQAYSSTDAQASLSENIPRGPSELAHPGSSALFDVRPWTTLLLNEGSFIQAYNSHEFWLIQVPSILPDLVGSVEDGRKPLISPGIRDMEYISLFPMSRHFSHFAMNLPRLDRLYVQIVPRNDILDRPEKMTMIEAENLWMERNSCYATVVRELFNAPPLGNYKYLQIFESGDAADRDAWLMAGKLFPVEYVKRSGNGWRIAGDGVFVRDSKDLAPERPDDGEGENLEFQGALIRWAWNGTTTLPISAYPLYELPLGPME
ncbi:uncharacterized protein BP5553_03453 [Venustampulla echinocandica]|uniref:F-box domain-containing protein n=1 Tax=Venustampulla echinocandica TaxID=2656787 RepID=A0A370TUA2_9HELO|nr:uncharacterized protein BP5553_03453 [Venustampulla echinocandica]RDL39113.1 hypothetical protein BP5553_03453 [Venustampulla echinocandica]